MLSFSTQHVHYCTHIFNKYSNILRLYSINRTTIINLLVASENKTVQARQCAEAIFFRITAYLHEYVLKALPIFERGYSICSSFFSLFSIKHFREGSARTPETKWL